MNTLEVGNASDVAVKLASCLPESISQTGKVLYQTLVYLGVETTKKRGHAPTTTEVVYHLPLEQLAAAVGVSRVTAWRHLRALRSLGLVDYRTHKASCRGETRNSGTVWRVRLSPVRGCRARLSRDDLKHKWRDMDADLRRGRTSYTELKHTKALKDKLLKTESLLTWTLPRYLSTNPVKSSVCFNPSKRGLEALLDLTAACREDRGAAVDRGAQALSQALRDASSVSFYQRLLWQLLRRYDAAGDDYSYRIFMAAQRAAVDAQEWRELRRPGGLLISRLRGIEWFAEMMAAPPTRVGPKPIVQA